MTRFAAGDRVYLDSNVFIYLVEGEAVFVAAATALFDELQATGSVPVTSELTIAECLWAPAKRRQRGFFMRYEAIFDSGDIGILPLDGQLARRAAIRGGRMGLRLPDAIHYVSALDAGCRSIVTNDRAFKPSPDMAIHQLVP